MLGVEQEFMAARVGAEAQTSNVLKRLSLPVILEALY